MADLTHIFSGGFKPPTQAPISRPEDQLRDTMITANLTPPDEIIMDGQIHRFKSSPKSKDKSGWYVVYPDGVPAGRFGCWRDGVEISFKADIGRKYTAAEEMTFIRRMSEAKAARDVERKRQYEITADTVERIWVDCTAASPEHPYLKRKGIGVNGARVTGDGRLVVPLYDPDGRLATLQYISEDGQKLYHSGGKAGGSFWMLGTMDDPGTLYIAEGFATAATIREVTNRPCVVAYSASSLVPVAEVMRQKYGLMQDIVIVADNDASGVGQKYADQASAKYGARVVMPPELGDANDYAQSGNDLLALLEPPQDDWLISADEFSQKPSPITWLVKSWLQSQALIMVHGQSGGGKTFVMLDWCLRIASNTAEWFGNKVKFGTVVYLAGEGHQGLRARIAAWKQHHGAEHLNMWLSKDGCDLNTASGYQRVLEHIRSLNEKPSIIVVDTLHRFLLGDENSAQDAKTMLDACNALMNEFGCSVVLVHHTGVSSEAQHRARGSSAWRGALDIEISIIPATESKPMEIHQRKSKDAELAHPLYARLEQVAINGWLDEDGNAVTSAVLVQADKPVEQKENHLSKHRQMFERAWFASGADFSDGKPYISRSALMDFLTNNANLKESGATQWCKQSAKGKPVYEMVASGLIEKHEHGWVVVDNLWSSALMLSKNEEN